MLLAVDEFDDAELQHFISNNHARMNRAKASFIAAVAEFDERGLCRSVCAATTANWLVREFHIAESTAFEYVRVGKFLRKHHVVSDAFYAHKLTYSVVRYLMSFIDDDTDPEDEVSMVEAACELTPTELRRALGIFTKPKHDKSEGMQVSVGQDGWANLRIRLNPRHAAEALAALKIGELSNRGELDKISRFGAPLPNQMLSAFFGMVNIVRNHPTAAATAPGAEVTYVVTEDGHSVLSGQPEAQPDAIVATLFNSRVRTLLVDRLGNAQKLSTPQRFATNAQVKALLELWGKKCAVPGCSHTRWLEFHHITPWEEGGVTKTFNLLPLCSHCHSLVTDGLAKIWVDRSNPELLHFVFGERHYISQQRTLPMLADRIVAGDMPVAA
ncbi:HNH endonuclease signature motif containing protein [Corynebacterium tapiri]|uniref:HNH endonuclease signature motif containing protein n=1 Tax=Corynebacterium tapiri TaxID=1448266 RepID=UPI0015D5FF6B|nr:HNH endonuclease signature motif containing protein [Corynebacterium tapiri]